MINHKNCDLKKNTKIIKWMRSKPIKLKYHE